MLKMNVLSLVDDNGLNLMIIRSTYRRNRVGCNPFRLLPIGLTRRDRVGVRCGAIRRSPLVSSLFVDCGFHWQEVLRS